MKARTRLRLARCLLVFTVFCLPSLCSFADQSFTKEELELWEKVTSGSRLPPESLINPPCDMDRPVLFSQNR